MLQNLSSNVYNRNLFLQKNCRFWIKIMWRYLSQRYFYLAYRNEDAVEYMDTCTIVDCKKCNFSNEYEETNLERRSKCITASNLVVHTNSHHLIFGFHLTFITNKNLIIFYLSIQSSTQKLQNLQYLKLDELVISLSSLPTARVFLQFGGQIR